MRIHLGEQKRVNIRGRGRTSIYDEKLRWRECRTGIGTDIGGSEHGSERELCFPLESET